MTKQLLSLVLLLTLSGRNVGASAGDEQSRGGASSSSAVQSDQCPVTVVNKTEVPLILTLGVVYPCPDFTNWTTLTTEPVNPGTRVCLRDEVFKESDMGVEGLSVATVKGDRARELRLKAGERTLMGTWVITTAADGSLTVHQPTDMPAAQGSGSLGEYQGEHTSSTQHGRFLYHPRGKTASFIARGR